jgi:mannose-6-phosphate isomerase-like protein (cupin superfamily)
MPIIYSAKAKSIEIPGAKFLSLATPSTGSKETATWRFTISPNSPGLSHQLTREEIMVATEGSAIAHIGTEKHAFASGDAIIIPPFVDFKLENPNAKEFSGIAIMPIGGKAVVGNEEPFTPPWAV